MIEAGNVSMAPSLAAGVLGESSGAPNIRVVCHRRQLLTWFSYFNTVGSKEGWTPSTFVSSRSNRRKDDKFATQQRPEDFMDDEDIADAEESRKLQTSQAFAGLGATDNDIGRATGLAGLFHVQGETMGTKLLKKMGWREGQGIGPKVRRRAKLDLASRSESEDTYLFAPENVAVVGFLRKADRKGLGYEGESRLAPLASLRSQQLTQEEDEDGDEDGLNLGRPMPSSVSKKKEKRSRGGIGIGVLNDTGSDDEDPYEIGPRISYNRVIGGTKSKKKKGSSSSTSINPALKSKPVFMPKRNAAPQAAAGLRKCHDGRPPLEGFVLAQSPDPIISMITADGKYPPPEIPAGWKSSKKPEVKSENLQYTSTADAAKASQLNPTARAALLGEKPLPGKSVFDFLSPAARDRVAAVTGKANLPQAKGEVPEGYALSEGEKRRNILDRIPTLDKQSALGAMARGASGGGPYGDNEDKRARYRGYLELQAGLRSQPPDKPAAMKIDEWMQEFHEFYNVARIFRPMTGSMASRFTTSSTPSNMTTGSDGKAEDAALLAKAPQKPEDPAETAAKMNMYGAMTRTIRDFYPSRLLCKRFNVKPPTHVQADGGMRRTEAARAEAEPMDEVLREAPKPNPLGIPARKVEALPGPQRQLENHVDMSKNEALEGKRPGEDVFKAIFGDSSDEEN